MRATGLIGQGVQAASLVAFCANVRDRCVRRDTVAFG